MTLDATQLLTEQWQQANRRLDRLEAHETNNLPIINAQASGVTLDGTDTRTSIQRVIDVALATDGSQRAIYFGPGDYPLQSTVGSGRTSSTLLLDTGENIRLVGAPGARFIIGNGAWNRAILIRNCTNVSVEGIEFICARTDGVATNGIGIENSSRVVIDGVLIDGFPTYGLGITEDTSTAVFASSSISFDATGKRINAPAGSFVGGPLGYTPGGAVSVTASLFNDGVLTLAAVDPGGAWLQVNETLTDEAAGSTTPVLVSTKIAFDAVSQTISLDAGGLEIFPDNGVVNVAGSGGNDGTYPIVDVDVDGTSMVVSGTLVTEAAGATVTLSKVARPAVNVQLATPCNDITIKNCLFQNIGLFGIEHFPKALSRNVSLVDNTFYNIGWAGNGGAMKPGQATANTIVMRNKIAHCVHSMLVGNWETMTIADNIVDNGYAFGIVVSCSNHPKYQANFTSLTIRNNQLSYTKDYVSGADFSPGAPNTFDPARRTYGAHYDAIALNGLMDALHGPQPTIGPIDVDGALVTRWGEGLGVNKAVSPFPNLTWRNCRLFDCGQSAVEVLTARGTVVSGSNQMTNFSYLDTDGVTLVPSTAGWYRNTLLLTDTTYLPAGTRIQSVNAATQVLTLTNVALPAAGAGTVIGVSSAYPIAMQVINNEWAESEVSYGATPSRASTSQNAIKLYSPNALFTRNTVRGYGPFALQVKGDGMMITNNQFIRNNQVGTSGRTPILFAERGTYKVVGNYLDVAAVSGANPGGAAQYFGLGIILAGAAGLGGSVSLQSRDNIPSFIGVQGASGVTQVPIPTLSGGMRTVIDMAPPTSGAWFVGERVLNAAPTRTINIAFWECVVSGTPGSWRACGVGDGLAAALPGTLTANDAGYLYQSTDTGVFKYWDGSAWDPLTGGAAPATLAGATFITQTPSTDLSAEQALSLLVSGYLKSTTGTGVVSAQAVPIPPADGGTGAAALTAGSVPYIGAAGVYSQDTLLTFDATNKRISVGIAAAIAAIHAAVVDAATNTSPRVYRMTHNSSSVPLAGFGIDLSFGLQSSTTADQNAARLLVQWVDPTHATRMGRVTQQAYDATTARTCIIYESDGTQGMVGFLGAAAVARAAAYTQTFSTAARTVPGYTTNAQNAAYTGINNAQAGTPYAQLADLNSLRVAYENLRASYDAVMKVVNALIDDSQALGFAG